MMSAFPTLLHSIRFSTIIQVGFKGVLSPTIHIYTILQSLPHIPTGKQLYQNGLTPLLEVKVERYPDEVWESAISGISC